MSKDKAHLADILDSARIIQRHLAEKHQSNPAFSANEVTRKTWIPRPYCADTAQRLFPGKRPPRSLNHFVSGSFLTEGAVTPEV